MDGAQRRGVWAGRMERCPALHPCVRRPVDWFERVELAYVVRGESQRLPDAGSLRLPSSMRRCTVERLTCR